MARDRATNAPVSVGFWSDFSTVTAQVIEPDTGSTVSRSFYGAGGLISIDAIPAISTVTVQRIAVHMSQLDEQVETAVRDYNVSQARVEIHRGLLDPDTRKMVGPAYVRFVGFVDTIDISTPAEGGDGGVTLSCVSHTQELTRANPDVRSNNSQKQRDINDAFYLDVGIVGQWEMQWGEASGQVQTEKPKGLFGWGNFLGFL